MKIHLDFLIEHMKSYDPDYLVELLDISTEAILDRFRDYIEDKQDYLIEEMEILIEEDVYNLEQDQLDMDDIDESY